MTKEKLNSIGYDIIGCAYEVRKTVGPLLRENYYKHALAFELRERGHTAECEVILPALYKGHQILDSFRIDILVDNEVLVETKSLPLMSSADARQLMTYLKVSGRKLGYLINFGAKELTSGVLGDSIYDKGIYRLVNNI